MMRYGRLAWWSPIVVGVGLTASMVACSLTTSADSTSTEEAKPVTPTVLSTPLKDFSKNPEEEVVKIPETRIVSKADREVETTRRAQEAVRRDIGEVHFAFDRWVLTSEDKKILLEDAAYLKQHSELTLIIEGYCDERGSREYNLVLGEKRAKEAMHYLTALGIKNPMKVLSYGEERPVCTDHNEPCYWKNRRAHLTVDEGK